MTGKGAPTYLPESADFCELSGVVGVKGTDYAEIKFSYQVRLQDRLSVPTPMPTGGCDPGLFLTSNGVCESCPGECMCT